jgi:hypothetical protein
MPNDMSGERIQQYHHDLVTRRQNVAGRDLMTAVADSGHVWELLGIDDYLAAAAMAKSIGTTSQTQALLDQEVAKHQAMMDEVDSRYPISNRIVKLASMAVQSVKLRMIHG